MQKKYLKDIIQTLMRIQTQFQCSFPWLCWEAEKNHKVSIFTYTSVKSTPSLISMKIDLTFNKMMHFPFININEQVSNTTNDLTS
jgi:hypothetical protein